MTIFLIFMAVLSLFGLQVAWFLGRAVLRIAPMYFAHKRRTLGYENALREAFATRMVAEAADSKVNELAAKLAKLEDEQVNEILARRR